MRAITFGKLYGGDFYRKPGRQPVQLWRRGQRCRWYTAKGYQVGPEQRNVAPALAWAMVHGYASGWP